MCITMKGLVANSNFSHFFTSFQFFTGQPLSNVTLNLNGWFPFLCHSNLRIPASQPAPLSPRNLSPRNYAVHEMRPDDQDSSSQASLKVIFLLGSVRESIDYIYI